MQFERIRKNHKRKIIIGGLILVCVISAITITTTRAKYKLTEDIPLVRGSINYKSYDFKVMAMYKSDDKINYIEINEMPSEGYSINEEKSYCNLSNGNKDTTAVLKTIDGNHTIGKLKKSDRCYLYFDKRLDITISDIISANNPKETVPDFSQIATADEGMFKTSDGMYGGYSYYWRGSVTNNYVKFGGFCWRIIRINGDGSMRLIYDGSSCHANGTNTTESFVIMNQSYNSSSDRSEYVGYTYTIGSQRTLNGTASNLKAQNETWYNNNIENNIAYASKIADGKYCNDRDIQTGSNWTATGDSFYYAGYKRLNKDYSPKLSCNLSDVYTLKVGAITADEVVMAGGKVKHQMYHTIYIMVTIIGP